MEEITGFGLEKVKTEHNTLMLIKMSIKKNIKITIRQERERERGGTWKSAEETAGLLVSALKSPMVFF